MRGLREADATLGRPRGQPEVPPLGYSAAMDATPSHLSRGEGEQIAIDPKRSSARDGARRAANFCSYPFSGHLRRAAAGPNTELLSVARESVNLQSRLGPRHFLKNSLHDTGADAQRLTDLENPVSFCP